MLSSVIEEQPNRIVDFYEGCTIFITGATGFIGKLLVEKLLRCTNVKQIYLLIRPKKAKTSEERFKEFFNNLIFDVLKKERPTATQKVQFVIGDITAVHLGLSLEHLNIIHNEVELIFHSAATTRFDSSAHTAVSVNTRGTKYMLDLAEGCQKLKCFIHVSTAYTFPKEKLLLEKMYEPPADPHKILTTIEGFTEEEDKEFTKKILSVYPNTYTFSKALAEVLVYEQFNNIPAIIARPSIVVPTLKQPIAGWCQSLSQGPMGLMVGAGKGIVRSMYLKSDSKGNVIPADIAVNNILSIAWFYTTKSNSSRIFNLTSELNYTWVEIVNEAKDIVRTEIPFNNILWYPDGSMVSSRILHEINFFLFQIIPALLIDALLICLGYKPILLNIQKRIRKGTQLLDYYANRIWYFEDVSKKKVRAVMNDREIEMFEIDAEVHCLRDYLINSIYTIRRNNLKDTDDKIPAAWNQMRVYVLQLLYSRLQFGTSLNLIHMWRLFQRIYS